MSQIKHRRRAIELRKLGWTYSEIRNELGVSKGALSYWLSKYPLTNEQFTILSMNRANKRLVAIEKTRVVKQEKRKARLQQAYDEQKLRWSHLTPRELEVAGIFLYWGEGAKLINGPISLNNTDSKVLKFTLYWLTNGLGISREKIKVQLHLYSDMDVKKEIQFWINELHLPLSQFSKPYIKLNKKADIDQKGFGHGTCGLIVSNILLKERIMMTIQVIADTHKNS